MEELPKFLKCKYCSARIKVNSVETKKLAKILYWNTSGSTLLDAAQHRRIMHIKKYHPHIL